MKKIIALLSILGILVCCFASCASSSGPEEKKDDAIVSSETDISSPEDTEDGQQENELSFLQKEKAHDPIFEWEDPYADLSPNEIDLLQETMSEDEYNEYFRMHFMRQYAEENYPVYYYYYSGRSEYREGVNTDNPAYDLLPATASYAVPDSFILNMLADACVEMHIKDSFPVTVERTYQDEEEREKMESMGEKPTYEATNLVFAIDRCLWGDIEEDEIFVFPRLMSQDFIDILSDPSKTIVAFLWRSDIPNDSYNHTGLSEYTMLVRGTFDYTEGKLKTYSNLEDVAIYNGKTAEEMIESGKELAVKYKEVLDYVRSR